MERIQATQGPGPTNGTGARRRRRTVRLLLPLGAAGVAVAATLVPALASGSGGPDLPETSAEELLTKLASSDVRSMSGSVRVSTDLGLPGGILTGGTKDMGASPFGPGMGSLGAPSSRQDGGEGPQRHRGGDDESPAPQSMLRDLLSGTHTVRVAVDGPDRHRVSIVEDAAEYSLIHNGDEVWTYDSASDRAFHRRLPAGAGAGAGHGDRGRDKARHGDRKDGHMLPGDLPATPDEAAERVLKALDDTTSVTVDGTTRVAGHDAYKLRFAPKQSGSTVDAVTIAVDADNGAPLRFSLTAKDGGKPVFDIGYTEVSFARPAAKSFTFTPPKGTKVTEGREEHHWVKGDGHRGNWHRRGEGRGPAGLGLDALGPGGLGPGAPAGGNVKVTGKAWSTVIEARLPDGGLDGTVKGRHRDLPEGLDAGSLLKGFGDEVKGRFGSGTMIHTRLVNVLITDDGRVLAGAVTKDTLVKAAGK